MLILYSILVESIQVDSKSIGIAVLGGLIGIGAVVVFSTLSQNGPKVPDVKFINFSPTDDKVSIREGQGFSISSKVENKEPTDVSNVQVDISFSGDQKFFSGAMTGIQVSPTTIGKGGGQSSPISIPVKSTSLYGQTDVGSSFIVTLRLGDTITHTENFDVRVEK